jgi:hypothetical protein
VKFAYLLLWLKGGVISTVITVHQNDPPPFSRRFTCIVRLVLFTSYIKVSIRKTLAAKITNQNQIPDGSVADPDPGSGTFLPPGSGISKQNLLIAFIPVQK